MNRYARKVDGKPHVCGLLSVVQNTEGKLFISEPELPEPILNVHTGGFPHLKSA